MVSVAGIDHDGSVPFSAIAFDAGAAHVAATRVVTADTAVVPAAPGSAVWSWMNGVAMPVNEVPRMTLSHGVQRFADEMPTVIRCTPVRWLLRR
jgi:hypothetical protein